MMDYQQYGVGSQLAPQGFFGSLIGAPLGGLIGRGIGGLFGNANLGNQIGQAAGGVGGAILPFGADPVSAAYAQQAQQQAQQQLQQMQLQQLQQQIQQEQLAQQLAPQGWLGNLVARVAQPLGGAIGGIFGNAGLGNTIGGVASKIGGMLPFANDPVTAAYAQQAQQQQLQQLQQAQLAQQIQQEQLAQQLAPQGWLGNLIARVAQPIGGAIGGHFGNAGLGNTIGGVASKIGGMLPFTTDPVSAAYAQQAQQQQQQQQLQQLQQIQQAQVAQQLAQQGQLTPQGGWFGNFLGQVGQPLGSAIGGIFGNAGLGGTIGGIAGKIGSVLPFGADPVAAAYAQQAQLAQQQAQLAQLAQQQQQAQIGQQLANGTYNAYQSPGIVPPNVYAAAGQQTLH